jgi:hypothetical protein
MSITIDATETAELRRALLEDLPSVARRFEDVAPEDASRLRWCLWQELVLLRALGWRGEVFEHERELDGACLLGVQQLFRRANGVLGVRVGCGEEEGLGWVLGDLRPRSGREPSCYPLTAPAPSIVRTLTYATHDACSRLRVVLASRRGRGRGSVLVALSAVALCARLCERVVRLSEVAAEGGDAA